MAYPPEPLRIIGNLEPDRDPRLDLRPFADLNIAEVLNLIGRRFGVTDTDGEITIELVYRHGHFVRGHKHETFTAGNLDTNGEAA